MDAELELVLGGTTVQRFPSFETMEFKYLYALSQCSKSVN